MKKRAGRCSIIAGVILLAVEAVVKITGTGAITLLHSTDGPTAVFLAGKVGGGTIGFTVIGVMLIVAGIFMSVKE